MGFTNNSMVMETQFFRIYPILVIIVSITFSHTKVSANLNPLKWFHSQPNSSSIIEVENNGEKDSQNLVKKLSKYKSKDNIKGQQRIYKKILSNYPRSLIAKEAAYNRGLFLYNKEKWEEAFQAFSIIKEYTQLYKLDSVIEMQFSCTSNSMQKTTSSDGI